MGDQRFFNKFAKVFKDVFSLLLWVTKCQLMGKNGNVVGFCSWIIVGFMNAYLQSSCGTILFLVLTILNVMFSNWTIMF